MSGVGPVLHAGPLAEAVVAAIRDANRDALVQNRGSYVRVLVPGHCVVRRKEIESHAGAAFRFPSDLEAIMPSFRGKLRIDEDEATWDQPDEPSNGGGRS